MKAMRSSPSPRHHVGHHAPMVVVAGEGQGVRAFVTTKTIQPNCRLSEHAACGKLLPELARIQFTLPFFSVFCLFYTTSGLISFFVVMVPLSTTPRKPEENRALHSFGCIVYGRRKRARIEH